MVIHDFSGCHLERPRIGAPAAPAASINTTRIVSSVGVLDEGLTFQFVLILFISLLSRLIVAAKDTNDGCRLYLPLKSLNLM